MTEEGITTFPVSHFPNATIDQTNVY